MADLSEALMNGFRIGMGLRQQRMDDYYKSLEADYRNDTLAEEKRQANLQFRNNEENRKLDRERLTQQNDQFMKTFRQGAKEFDLGHGLAVRSQNLAEREQGFKERQYFDEQDDADNYNAARLALAAAMNNDPSLVAEASNVALRRPNNAKAAGEFFSGDPSMFFSTRDPSKQVTTSVYNPQRDRIIMGNFDDPKDHHIIDQDRTPDRSSPPQEIMPYNQQSLLYAHLAQTRGGRKALSEFLSARGYDVAQMGEDDIARYGASEAAKESAKQQAPIQSGTSEPPFMLKAAANPAPPPQSNYDRIAAENDATRSRMSHAVFGGPTHRKHGMDSAIERDARALGRKPKEFAYPPLSDTFSGAGLELSDMVAESTGLAEEQRRALGLDEVPAGRPRPILGPPTYAIPRPYLPPEQGGLAAPTPAPAPAKAPAEAAPAAPGYQRPGVATQAWLLDGAGLAADAGTVGALQAGGNPSESLVSSSFQAQAKIAQLNAKSQGRYVQTMSQLRDYYFPQNGTGKNADYKAKTARELAVPVMGLLNDMTQNSVFEQNAVGNAVMEVASQLAFRAGGDDDYALMLRNNPHLIAGMAYAGINPSRYGDEVINEMVNDLDRLQKTRPMSARDFAIAARQWLSGGG